MPGEGLDGGACVGVDEADAVALGNGEGLTIGSKRDNGSVAIQRNTARSLDGLSPPEFYFAITAAGEERAIFIEF